MTTIIILSAIIVMQQIVIAALQRNHHSVYTGTALRLRMAVLSALHVPVWVVALDIRKMKSLNECLGYNQANHLIGKLFAITRRRRDIIGQYGGDEFIICGIGGKPNTAEMVVARLLEKAGEISASLSYDERQTLRQHTGGLVDGLHLAVCYTATTRNAMDTARRCIDAADAIKNGGRDTGDRNTSGKAGTLITVLE